MRFTYNVLRYVKHGLQRALRAVRAVNVFKKKIGGASLCKSEEIKKLGRIVITMKTDKTTGKLITSFSSESY